MNLATPKEPREVRMQAAFFFQQLCQSRFSSFVFDFVKESCYDFLIWRHCFLYILVSVYTFHKSYNLLFLLNIFFLQHTDVANVHSMQRDTHFG